jgi:thiol-disulfide isomerase/thioredoxin
MTDKRWTLDPAIDEYLATMTVSEELIKELMAERGPIEAASPNPGDAAPDFEAEQLSTEGRRTGEPLKLSDLRGRPVALQFGSYTCPVWRGQIDRFNEIYDELKDQFEFVTVYTREAHPEDGWQVDINHTQGVVYDQPTTADQSRATRSNRRFCWTTWTTASTRATRHRPSACT